jgi:hypothetical protein
MDAAEFYTDLCDVVERAYMRAPVAPSPGDLRCTSDYARQAANRILELVGQAMAKREEEHEAAVLQVIDERDEAIEAADQLADFLADITGAEVGEHSSTNEPWRNAMQAADEYLRSPDYEYGIRLVNSPAAPMHRTGLTRAEAEAFMDPAEWVGMPRPMGEVFEIVRRRRRHSAWKVVP